MTYLIVLSLVSALCATEVILHGTPEEGQPEVRCRMVGSTSALQRASERRAEAPVAVTRPWKMTDVLGCVGLLGLVAYMVYQFGFAEGDCLVCAAINQ